MATAWQERCPHAQNAAPHGTHRYSASHLDTVSLEEPLGQGNCRDSSGLVTYFAYNYDPVSSTVRAKPAAKLAEWPGPAGPGTSLAMVTATETVVIVLKGF
jgi:hypothetical protein